MEESEEEREPEGVDQADAPQAKRRKKWPIALAVVVVVAACAGGGMWVWHEQPSFCAAICHDTMNSYVESWEDSSYTVHAHAEQGIACLDCHKPVLSEQVQEAVKQVSGDYTLPLAKMEVDDSFCLRDGCHTRADVEQGTATMEVDGTKVNPHTQTVNAAATNPHDGSGEQPACSECHTMHRASKGMDYCYSCHHAETFAVCESCHDHR